MPQFLHLFDPLDHWYIELLPIHSRNMLLRLITKLSLLYKNEFILFTLNKQLLKKIKRMSIILKKKQLI